MRQGIAQWAANGTIVMVPCFSTVLICTLTGQREFDEALATINAAIRIATAAQSPAEIRQAHVTCDHAANAEHTVVQLA